MNIIPKEELIAVMTEKLQEDQYILNTCTQEDVKEKLLDSILLSKSFIHYLDSSKHTTEHEAPKVYIAGKVTGLPIHEVTMKFGNAQKAIEAQGLIAINPLEVVNNWHLPWEQAMKLCVKALLDCNAVYLLPCWNTSKGAITEHLLAKELNIPIMIGDIDVISKALNQQ